MLHSPHYVPLTLAYARTIHKFQGLTAGPTKPGKPENMYKCIVCDPDEKKWEGNAIGLLYTAVSRATTLGDEDGLNSAIYFTGSDFKADRIQHLYKKKDSFDDYTLAAKRKEWVDHIHKRTKVRKFTKEQLQQTKLWATTYSLTYNELYKKIKRYGKQKTDKALHGRKRYRN